MVYKINQVDAFQESVGIWGCKHRTCLIPALDSERGRLSGKISIQLRRYTGFHQIVSLPVLFFGVNHCS